MQIKEADGHGADLVALGALLQRPDLGAENRRAVEREIKVIRAGDAGERDAAYEIEFHNGNLAKRATIHDLRLEVDGRVAQIDHLIIDRLLTIWVCESKHFAEGVGVNDHGEWVRFWQGRPTGIASPVEQNRKHIDVLRDVFDWAARYGIAPRPIVVARPVDSGSAPIGQSGRGPASGRTCDSCGIAVSVGVARFAEEHADRFARRVMCMRCQKATSG